MPFISLFSDRFKPLSGGIDSGIIPTPTPTPTPTNTPTPTITPSNTPTPSITPTITPTPSTPVSNCDTFTFVENDATTTTNTALAGPSGGWTSSAYSVETYTNPVSVTFQTSTDNVYFMGGFSYNPTLNAQTYQNTTYGFYIQRNFLEIYENGGQATVPGSMTNTTSDTWKVDYNGTNVKYYKNDVLIYTSSNAVTQPLHVFFALLTPNEGATNICVKESLEPTPTPTITPTKSGVVSNGQFVYVAQTGIGWNGYGGNYLSFGNSQDGSNKTPLAGWYFKDSNNVVRRLLNNPLWFSGGSPSPYRNGNGWMAVANGSFYIAPTETTITFYETSPV